MYPDSVVLFDHFSTKFQYPLGIRASIYTLTSFWMPLKKRNSVMNETRFVSADPVEKAREHFTPGKVPRIRQICA
jgi:hypothetical protein